MASIRDVAKLADVSPATVSQVLNGTANVAPETRDRVMQAIAQTEFVPNGPVFVQKVRQDHRLGDPQYPQSLFYAAGRHY